MKPLRPDTTAISAPDRPPSEEHLAARRILAVTEEELQRIILDVHDGPVQQIFAALAQIGVVQKRRASCDTISDKDWDGLLSRLSFLLEGALKEVRSFLGDFRAPDFLQREMADIIEALVLQFEASTDCQVAMTLTDRRLPASQPVKIALYRTCQEALFNAYRHSGVDRQRVRLGRVQGQIVLEISDQGRGFVPPPLSGAGATEREEHIGLRGMRDRVGLIGGEFELHSAPGQGTRVVVRVPADE